MNELTSPLNITIFIKNLSISQTFDINKKKHTIYQFVQFQFLSAEQHLKFLIFFDVVSITKICKITAWIRIP